MSRHSGGTDRSLVSALRAKVGDAAADVYDLHAERLYGYVRGFLDPSTASDVVHDAVWIAIERIRTLRDPDMFRPWLYAIARSECVRASSGSALGYVPAGPEADVDSETTVLAPVHALDPTDLEAVDLTVRHGFTDRQVAAIIGRGFDVAAALEHASAASTDPAGQLDRLPTAPPPPYLRNRVLTAPPSAAERTAMGRRIDPVDRTGFPAPGRPRRAIVAWGASAAGVAALVAVAVFAFVDRAPAEQSVPSPSGATLRVDFGDYPEGTTAPVTTRPTTASPETSTSTVVPAPVTTTEVTDAATETSSPQTSIDPSPTTESSPTTTETGWTSRRDRSRNNDSDDESDRSETDGSTGGGSTNTAPPVFTFEPGVPSGLSEE
ncbi:RNA polymerase sigma factor [Rhodococcus artemisiae]|uniref:Sigma-70 family RNA polymerase sigma factor n=1 Tax=Rhodococcus artemisiae TaxID=714159 RepID=A0ABU7LGB0_9NOCA|nr:sigma-70 family RNA polymerase sigma factor [Rhodococcus artemisiae]MEE2060586.1 sigma-70 family RNA polymerase sigma factor [Rhodococcus artemisiae]